MINQELIEAIKNCQIVAYQFNGELCFAEPCSVGFGHDGIAAMMVFQTQGPTPLPGFRWVYRRIHAFENLQLTNSLFIPRCDHCIRDMRFKEIVAIIKMKPNQTYKHN